MAIEIIDTLGQKNNGEFPLVDSNDIKGGYYQVNTIEERNSIPSVRRKEGMLCHVKNDKIYQLIGGVDNECWIVFNTGTGTGGGFSGDYNDLINKPTIPSKTSDLVNDSGFITIDDLDSSQNHVHGNLPTLEKITEEKISEWDSKSNFDGDYNSLINKPTIPTVDVNKEYVDNELSKKSDVEHIHSYNDLTDKPEIPSVEGLVTKEELNETATSIEREVDEKISKISSEIEVDVYHVGVEPPTDTEILWIDIEDENLDITDKTVIDEITTSISNNKARIEVLGSRVEEFSAEDNLTSSNSNKPLSAKQGKVLNDKIKVLNEKSHEHSNIDVISKITSSKISSWDNKSNFSGSYDDLTNKPTIPNLQGYATETFVRNEIANASLGDGDIDTNNFATKEELNNKADRTELHNHSNKSIIDGITSEKINEWDNKSTFSGNYNDLKNKPTIPSLDGYATEQFVKEEVGKAQLEGGEVDLSGYALKTELHNHTNKSILDGITSTKITQWDNKSNFSGSYNDLANKPTIPTRTSQLSNDSGFITTIPSEYVTESELSSKGYVTGTELNNKGYLTSIPSEYVTDSELNSKGYLTSIPSTYALKTDIPTSLPASGGNSATVGGLSIWTGTQAQYDAISTKSSTTIYMIKE